MGSIVRRIAVGVVGAITNPIGSRKIAAPDIETAICGDRSGDSETVRRLKLQIVHVQYRKRPWVIELLLEYSAHFGGDSAAIVCSHCRDADIHRSKVEVTILPCV